MNHVDKKHELFQSIMTGSIFCLNDFDELLDYDIINTAKIAEEGDFEYDYLILTLKYDIHLFIQQGNYNEEFLPAGGSIEIQLDQFLWFEMGWLKRNSPRLFHEFVLC